MTLKLKKIAQPILAIAFGAAFLSPSLALSGSLSSPAEEPEVAVVSELNLLGSPSPWLALGLGLLALSSGSSTSGETTTTTTATTTTN